MLAAGKKILEAMLEPLRTSVEETVSQIYSAAFPIWESPAGQSYITAKTGKNSAPRPFAHFGKYQTTNVLGGPRRMVCGKYRNQH